MDLPITINWMSPILFLGALGVIFILFFFSFFDGILLSKQNSSSWDAAFCGLFCLPMSHKKDARFIHQENMSVQ